MNSNNNYYEYYAKNVINNIYPYLINDLEIYCPFPIENKIILEIGTGPGYVLKALSKKKFSKILGIDKSLDMLLRAKQLNNHADKLTLCCSKAEKIPFKTAYVDIVISRGSMFFWDDIEAVDVSALHVPSCFCRVGIGRQRVWHLERLQRADDVSGRSAAVLVHNSQRQLFRQSLLHQRREKEAAEEREDHGATQKERAAEQLLRLRHKHFPKAFSDLFHVSERQCRGFDNIENSAAGGSL